MLSYYDQQLRVGEAFERVVVQRFKARGASIERHVGRRAQFEHGDTTLGMEIKFDRNFATTRNLFIEVAEKKRADQPEWRASGIFAHTDARWYGIGDYETFFVFSLSMLRELHPLHREIEIGRRTSRGFLLSETAALTCATRVLTWGKSEQKLPQIKSG